MLKKELELLPFPVTLNENLHDVSGVHYTQTAITI